MTRRKAALVIAAICGAAVATLYLRREIAIDDCLDLGGRWNYANAVCERHTLPSPPR